MKVGGESTLVEGIITYGECSCETTPSKRVGRQGTGTISKKFELVFVTLLQNSSRVKELIS